MSCSGGRLCFRVRSDSSASLVHVRALYSQVWIVFRHLLTFSGSDFAVERVQSRPRFHELNRSGNVDGGRSHSPPAAVSADAAAKERAADHDDEEVSEHREAFAEHDQREDYGKAHP